MKVKMEIKGLDEYLERIAQIGADVDEAAIAALEAGAAVAVYGMQRRAPFDSSNVTEPHLRDAINQSEVHSDGSFHWVEVGLVNADGPMARKANANEFGTSSMSAQPYIRPTMAEDKSKIIKAEKDVLTERGML